MTNPAPLVDRHEVRTIRLVSDVPDFAALYADSELTPRSAAKIWAVAEIIYDNFHHGLGEEILATLPPIARLHADERFESAFASRFAIVAKRVAEGLPWLESIATCTADEMAIHVILGATSPHAGLQATSDIHCSTLGTSSPPVQNGSGSLSTASAWTTRPSPRGGRQLTWSALG